MVNIAVPMLVKCISVGATRQFALRSVPHQIDSCYSHFRSWYKWKVMESATESDLRVALRKFFQFLATEKGMIHQKVLDALM